MSKIEGFDSFTYLLLDRLKNLKENISITIIPNRQL